MTPDQDNSDANGRMDGDQLAGSPHPGLFLRAEIKGRQLSVSEATEALRVLRLTLSAVLNGRAALSPEMALRCEKAFGLSMDALIRLQCAYDAGQVRAWADEVEVPLFVPRPKPGQASLL